MVIRSYFMFSPGQGQCQGQVDRTAQPRQSLYLVPPPPPPPHTHTHTLPRIIYIYIYIYTGAYADVVTVVTSQRLNLLQGIK